MEKKSSSLILLILLMLSGYVPTIAAFPPTGYDPTHLIIDSISEPVTLDPAWCYDTDSAECIFNVYETVIFFETVHTDFAWGPFEDGPYAAGKTDVFKPQLATDVSIMSGPAPYVKTFYFKIRGSSTTHTFVSSIDVNLFKDGQIYDGTYAVRDPEYGVVGKNQGPIRPATEIPPIDGYVDRFQVPANVYAGGSPMGTTWERGDGPAGTRGCVIRSWTDVDASWDLSVGDGFDVVRKCFNHPTGPHWNARNYYTVLSVDPGPPYIITAIEDPVYFHDGVSTLTPADVEYSWERWMVQDRSGGPTWMIYFPVLGVYGAVDPATDPNFGDEINNAIGSNATHAWISLSTDFPETTFLQIMSQSWASVVNKDWCVGLGDFDGNWAAGWETIYDTWHDPDVSFIEDQMMGTGPYELDYWFPGTAYSIVKFDDYWDGWPSYNSPTGTERLPGYLERVTLNLLVTWTTRRARFLAGDSDYTYVPRPKRDHFLGQEVCGEPIRCYYPFPMMALDAMFFTFNVSTGSPFLGPGFDPGDPNRILEDRTSAEMFSDISVRKGFAYAFDYNTYLAAAYLGEGDQPATPVKRGLKYHNPAQEGYYFDLTLAESYLKAAWIGHPDDDPLTPEGALWDNGMSFTIVFSSGNRATEEAAMQLENNLNALNPKFHISVTELWYFLGEVKASRLPLFFMCWTADYTDPHNFIHTFMHSQGIFSQIQRILLVSALVDELIEAGALTTDDTLPYNGEFAPEKHAENVAANGWFDGGEAIYRDVDGNGEVGADDVLVEGPAQADGTSLIWFNPIEKHAENVAANYHFDSGEAIYRDVDGNGVVSDGDVLVQGPAQLLGTPLKSFTVDPRDAFNNWPNIPPDTRWPKRSIYYCLQAIYHDDVQSIPLVQPVGRHWEQHWMRGWYYNPLYGGSLAQVIDSTAPEAPVTYFYHIWKALTHFGDANNDGTVGLLDAATISASWTKPHPASPIGPKGYLCCADINGGTGGVPGGGSGLVIGMPDGKVDIADAALVSAYWDGPPQGPSHPP